MADKTTLTTLLNLDSDGYINGFQQEFYDGAQWQVTFDTTNAVQLSEADTASIVIGATKYTDGQLVLDTAKQDELEKASQPVDSASEIAYLKNQLAEMQSAILELADVSLGGDTDAKTTSAG